MSGLALYRGFCYNWRLVDINGSLNVPKAAAKKIEKPNTDTASFVENVSKKGDAVNGRRIDFHFVRRKRKAN